jgi:hypothetical protein
MYRYPGNHVDSGIVTVPRKLKTRPGAPETNLAYITPDEEKILQQYKPGTPHRGPEEIPNYDTWGWDGSSGSSVTGGSTADGGGYSSGDTTGSWGGGEDWGAGGGTNEGGSNYDLKDTYTHHDTVYGNNAGNLPQDIPWSSDDKIADYSFSTPDVRASIMDKMKFRDRVADAGGSGWAEATDAELLGLEMYKFTNDRRYLTQPMFIPKDADWSKIKAGWDEANKTGNKEAFFSVVDDYVDITHGNPNQQYFDKVSGTDWDGWWKRPTTTTVGGGNDQGSSRRGLGSYFGNWGGSSGYGNPHGRYSKANWHLKNKYNYDAPFARILAERHANPVRPRDIEMYSLMMANANRGGIMDLRR